jgi:hypothetical protein
MMVSENQFEYNHHFTTINGSRFHVDPIDTRIGIVQVTNSEPPETVCYRSVASGALVSKWTRTFRWCSILGSIASIGVFLVFLR